MSEEDSVCREEFEAPPGGATSRIGQPHELRLTGTDGYAAEPFSVKCTCQRFLCGLILFSAFSFRLSRMGTLPVVWAFTNWPFIHSTSVLA